MAPTSGILYVTMQPRESLPVAQFHDWYDNEHGPGRLRLHFVRNGQENALVAVSLTLHSGKDKEEELARWYTEEHTPLLSKVPGWLRTRRFVTAKIEGKE